MECRFCASELTDVFIDLNSSPAANSFLTHEQLDQPEAVYPLKVYTCRACFLTQIAEYKKCDTIFDDHYVYFSSFSTSWLQHARDYTYAMVDRFGFNADSKVVEVASNDGYLLQYFKEQQIPVLGIEPTANTAAIARAKGIETITEFFGTKLAATLVQDGIKADLLIGNNVLAHVPDIVDFVKGMKLILSSTGIITMEFPHLMQLVQNNQFDTIYHEHFSYLSFYTVKQIFAAQGLALFDVDEIPTHGGSLRIYAKHAEDATKEISPNVAALLNKEIGKGMNTIAYYQNFQEKVEKIREDFTDFLHREKLAGKKIAGYGAAAKGNTFLNYCDVHEDSVSFVVDASPHKQNMWLPASHIPVVEESVLLKEEPDYIIILPWNLKTEIMEHLSYAKRWHAKFVTAIPALSVIEDILTIIT